MPDSLKDVLFNRFNAPIMPKEPVDHVANMIDRPRLERSPMQAGIDGFLAGSLQGLRDFATPANLLAMGFPTAKLGKVTQIPLTAATGKAEQALNLLKAAYNNYSRLKPEEK